MAKKPSSVGKLAAAESEILSYRHADRRKNNPEVGMVTPATDADDSKTTWQHDPHLDPSLSWTGKAERLSFEVDTVSLHVHERIDPASILSAVRKRVVAGETAKDKAKGAKAAQIPACSMRRSDALEAFHGTLSLPFAAGDNRKACGRPRCESLKVVNLEDWEMNAHVKELLEEAKKLSVHERIELADLIYADVPVDPEWEAAWAKEAQSRVEAYRRGEIEAVDADEMHARIAKKYGL